MYERNWWWGCRGWVEVRFKIIYYFIDYLLNLRSQIIANMP